MCSVEAIPRPPASSRRDPDAPIGVFESVELTEFIGGPFPVRVDIVNRARLKTYIRPQAEREAFLTGPVRLSWIFPATPQRHGLLRPGWSLPNSPKTGAPTKGSAGAWKYRQT